MSKAFASRFSETPLLLAPEKTTWFKGCLEAISVEPKLTEIINNPRMNLDDDDFWPDEDSYMASYRPYNVISGVLVIPVYGTLIANFGWQLWDWYTGYEYIQKAFDRGVADPEVKGILFDINSPGGEVNGNFDLVDYLFSQRGQKPTVAVANPSAYSAAYNIASAADQIIVNRAGGVGSIGVVTYHIDISQMQEKMGIKLTYVYAGDHKVDGNPYEPLADDVKERMQARVDNLYGQFVASVARNRGMTEEEVINTQALTYYADDAVNVGLADAVGSFSAVLTDFANTVNKGVIQMAGQTTVPEATEKTVDIDAVKAEASAEGFKAGASAERERFKTVMALPEAKDRTEVALNMLCTTDLSAEQCKGLLASIPAAATVEARNETMFETAMAKENPEVGAVAGQKTEQPTSEDQANGIINSFALASGKTVKK